MKQFRNWMLALGLSALLAVSPVYSAEISSSTFSETDASNNSASPNGFPEAMAPSGVNDSARMVMAAVKRFWSRIQGAYASTGSANAYVVTPTATLSAYVTGERYSWRANFTNTGTATVNWGPGAKTIQKMTASGLANLASGDIQSGQPVTVEYNGTVMILVTPPTKVATNQLPAGTVAQVVNTQTGAVATGTTTVPLDDTIPQITEGTEFMTQAITPTNTGSTLLIDVVFIGSLSDVVTLIAALFQDATASALAAAAFKIDAVGGLATVRFQHKMTAGTTSSTTFRVRAGPSSASTVTFNGTAGGRIFGGVMASSITITEILP